MSSKIRLLHGCPSLPSLDGYCSQQNMCHDVGYNHYSEYYDVDHGSYNISLCPSGQRASHIVDAYAYLTDGDAHTAILSGSQNDPNVFLVTDGAGIFNTDKAYVRFVNLAYDAPCLDFRFTDGAFVIANNIRYKEVTRYYPITPSTYQMQATICNSSFVVLRIPRLTFRPGRSYTLYITGSARQQPYCTHILAPDWYLPPQTPPPPPWQPPNHWQPPYPTAPTPPVITTWDCSCGCTPQVCCPPPPPPCPCCENTWNCIPYYPDPCSNNSCGSSGWSIYDSGYTHYYNDYY